MSKGVSEYSLGPRLVALTLFEAVSCVKKVILHF